MTVYVTFYDIFPLKLTTLKTPALTVPAQLMQIITNYRNLPQVCATNATNKNF